MEDFDAQMKILSNTASKVLKTWSENRAKEVSYSFIK